MANSNDAIKSMLGTTQGSMANTTPATNPALKNIATNGTLLIQNVGELNKKLAALITAWGG